MNVEVERGADVGMAEDVANGLVFAVSCQKHQNFNYSIKSLLPKLHSEQSVCKFSNTVSPPLAHGKI